MQFWCSTLLLVALSAGSAQALRRAPPLRNLSPLVKAVSTSRSPQANTLPMIRRQLGTDPSVCQTQCQGDTNILDAVFGCESDEPEINARTVCVCKQFSHLSSACETCILNNDGITPSTWATTCDTASAAVTTGTGVTTAAQPAVTASGDVCPSECSSRDDANGIQELNTCIDGDAGCFCASTSLLSSTCLACVLTESDVTSNQLVEICSAYSATASRGSTTGGSGDVTSSADNPVNTPNDGGSSGTTGGGSSGGSGGSGGSGSGTIAGGASGARTSAASATGTTRSAASKITVGGPGVFLACTFMVVGALMVLL
ncbi:hypothetical protein CALVIDRAFT_575431 [Calocera viscosa TUFC12733]|uniref:Extracellular membrane protein CFEM domain-containing protein n=1 Tax=Calocera viscosa (strain TUFC12733) TaxID=1330018 RepID=A0A167MFG7_CALVF|nr:hypothetical protein CALVIDRAFT_575431 [Calocera viscosa TUFC12733]